jgi:hypothetical protein
MSEVNLEWKSRIILGIMSIVLLLIYIAFSFGSQSWIRVLMILTGFLISIFLYSESSIISYVKSGQYKKLSWGDFVVMLTIVVATIIFFNSLFAIPTVGQAIPEGLLNFTNGIAIVVAIIGICLSFIHIFTKKFS